MKSISHFLVAAATSLLLTQCSAPKIKNADVVVSVADQKLGIYKAGQLVTSYKISTSKFGIGDTPGSNCTPLGKHEVIAKIGHGLPAGAVLKSRRWNGEVVKPNAPGRDPIVSRILWLGGKEGTNRNAARRFIYIHGTTEENRLGTKASYGCVRMAAKDVIHVFESVPVGATVMITKNGLPRSEKVDQPTPSIAPIAPVEEAPLPKAVPVTIGPNGAILAKDQKKEGEPVGPPSSNKKRLVLSVQS